MVKISTRKGSVSINGNNCIAAGGSLIINGKRIFIDGKEQSFEEQFSEIHITIQGDVEIIDGEFDTLKAGNVGSINTVSGDIKCGDISGSVATMSGDVTCRKIGGHVSTMSGDIRTGGYVE